MAMKRSDARIIEDNPIALRSLYRKSLLALGRSANTPIDSLTFAYLGSRPSTPEVKFLLSCKRLYRRMQPIEKIAMKTEILERGLHYRYWYIPAISERDYRKIRKKVSAEVYLCAQKEGLL